MPWLAVTARSAGDLGARHDARIGVRQQAGLAQHQSAHRGEIRDRRLVAERRQRLARGVVAQLRLVAEGEQRLGAARRRAGPGDGQHLIRRQEGRLARLGPFGEGAVVANIAAEMGERNEHLARIGDQPAVAAIAQPRRLRHQLGQLPFFTLLDHDSCPLPAGTIAPIPPRRSLALPQKKRPQGPLFSHLYLPEGAFAALGPAPYPQLGE